MMKQKHLFKNMSLFSGVDCFMLSHNWQCVKSSSFCKCKICTHCGKIIYRQSKKEWGKKPPTTPLTEKDIFL